MLELKIPLRVNTGARTPVIAACVLAAVLGVTPVSRAQAVDPATRAEPAEAPVARLGEVTVTATRVSRPLEKVSVPVTVVGMQRLQTEQINNYQDLARLVPSLHISQTFGIAQVFIRGLGVNSANSGEESSVGVYIDGAYVARPEAQLTSMFDIERVEVLSGPQGQLFGRNTIGGALNIVTNGPTRRREGYARLTIGKYSEFDTEGAIGGPLTADGEFRGRFAFKTETHAGFGKNVVNGNGVDDNNRRMARLELEYVPNDAFNNLFSAEYYFEDDHQGALHFEQESFPAFQSDPALAFIGTGYQATNPRDVASSLLDPKLAVQTWSFTDTTNWTLSRHSALTAILNYRQFQQDRLQDLGLVALLTSLGPNGEGPGSTVEGRNIRSNQHSIELQYKYNRGWLHGIVGFYNFHELQTGNGIVGAPPGSFVDPQNAAINAALANPAILILNGAPTAPQPIPRDFAFFQCRQSADGIANPAGVAPDFFCERDNQKTSSIAGYTQWHLGLGRLTPALAPFALKLGYRYTTEQHDAANTEHIVVLPINLVLENTFAGDRNVRRFNNSSPEAGLEWQITPNDLFYYTYAEGFKAGSAQGTGELDSQGKVVISLPETIWNNEFGLKTIWLGGRLVVNADGFFYRLANLQVQKVLSGGPGGFSFELSNGARVRAHGAELQFEAVPVPRLRLGGSVDWLVARFSDFVTRDPLDPVFIEGSLQFNPNAPQLQLAGNQTPNSPTWTANFNADYDIPGLALPGDGTLTLGGDMHYQSDTYFSEFDRLSEGQAAYTVGDVHLTYRSGNGHWSAEAWVNNVGNTLIKSGSFPLAGINAIGVTYLPPRTYGISFGYRL